MNAEYAKVPLVRAFVIRYLPQTNNKPTRLKITDLHRNETKTMSKDFEYRDCSDQAFTYLEKLGIPVIGVYENRRDTVFITNDMKTSILS